MSLASLSSQRRQLLRKLLEERGITKPAGSIPLRNAGQRNVPLSFAQERLYFFDRVQPGSALYVVAGALRIRGELDVEVLHATIRYLVNRHETLRTGFRTVADGTASQVVHPPESVDTELPVRQSSAATLEQDISELAQEGFDLTRPPLLRSVLMRISPSEYVLALCVHHIVVDGWSLSTLVAELVVIYPAFASGRDPALPELPLRYADFAVWQRSELSEEALSGQLEYWRNRLAGAAELVLPTDYSPPAVRSFAGGAVPMELPATLVARLRTIGQAEQATMFMVLAAAWSVVLARWSGSSDIVLGAAVAGRTRAELEGLVGFFVNTLPLRITLDERESFRKLLRRTRQQSLEAYANQDVPFERIVQELRPDRDSSGHSPIVRHLLVLHNTPQHVMRLPDLEVQVLPLHTATAKFDVEIELTPTETGGLTGALEFSTDLFTEQTAERIVAALCRVLDAVIDDPDRPVWQLPVLTEAARSLIVDDLSGAGVPPPTPPSRGVVKWFETVVDERPEDVAVVADAGHSMTFGELDARANAVAHRLRSDGVAPEERVGVCLERGVELVVAVLGVLKAGAAFVPLAPDYPSARLVELLEDAMPVAVLTNGELADGTGIGRHLLSNKVRIVRVDDVDGMRFSRPSVPVEPLGAAYVLFTSGSTGRPKGVVNTQEGLLNRLSWMRDRFQLRPGQTVLQKTPIGFDVSVWELLWPLLVGARMVLAKPGGHRDPAYLHELIRRHEVSLCHFVPSMLRAFLEVASTETETAPPALGWIVCSGEELPPFLAGDFLNRYPSVELHNLYGPTEAAIDVSAQHVRQPVGERISIGTPMPGVRLYVLDSRMRPLPVGVPGELFIGGIQLARGYLNKPGLTAERFVPHPFRAGERLYATGDRARWQADAALEFLGRTDNQIKIRGQRVELAEIETVLRTHAAVADAVVTVHRARPDEAELVAYVTGVSDVEELSEQQGEHVARWQAVFDQTYREDGGQGSADPTFDTAGWISSYTGNPIPDEEMREWVSGITDRVLALPHGRVLELGCGTGLLLFRIAPHCEHYFGTDISELSLARLRDRLGGLAERVTLERRAANDFTGIPDKYYDVVVLNSVAQYFPDADYLTSVLWQAVRAVRPGGAVVIGDVRNKSLLAALHASVQLAKLPATATPAELRRNVEWQIANEKELVIDPDLFRLFAAYCPEVTAVSVLPKLGSHHNELTKFRFDVVLRVGDVAGVTEPRTEAPAELAWNEHLDLVEQLAATRPLVIRGVPDTRVDADLRVAETAFAEPNEAHPATVGQLRAKATVRPSLPAIHELVGAAAKQRNELLVTLANPGRLDLTVVPSDTTVRPDGLRAVTAEPVWRELTNHPLTTASSAVLVSLIRSRLQQRLPQYMVPAHFIVLDSLPVGPNGKLDSKALPLPNGSRPDLVPEYVAPRTATERTVATIWADLLATQQIGVNDNFFDLGGHSLLATQVISRIRTSCGTDLKLGTFFESPTVAGIAGVVDRMGSSPSPPQIRRVDRERYRVLRQDP